MRIINQDYLDGVVLAWKLYYGKLAEERDELKADNNRLREAYDKLLALSKIKPIPIYGLAEHDAAKDAEISRLREALAIHTSSGADEYQRIFAVHDAEVRSKAIEEVSDFLDANIEWNDEWNLSAIQELLGEMPK